MNLLDGTTLYHGSSLKVVSPSLTHSRSDVDFGIGFYLTEDKKMAMKWAANRNKSYLNTYTFFNKELRIKILEPNQEWLDYIVSNRIHDRELPFDDSKYDVIIGPTADDKLFMTIDIYTDGFISSSEAIEVVNCMNYSNQVVFKNEDAIKKGLSFVSAKPIIGQEKEYYMDLAATDRQKASQKASDFIKQIKQKNRGG